MNWRRVRTVLASLLVLALSLLSVWDLTSRWAGSAGFGQMFSNLVQGAYTVLGLAAIVGLSLKASWTRPVLWAWAVALLLTGATAPMIWGEQGIAACLMAAAVTGAVAAAVIALVGWKPPARL